MHVWCWSKQSKAGRSRGAHASMASHQHTSGHRRAHNIHHMAGSKPFTHKLQNQEGSRCMCGVGRKKTMQAGEGHTLACPCTHITLQDGQP